MGEGLRTWYDDCLEMNARLRGLPWPPLAYQASESTSERGEDDIEAVVVEALVSVIDSVLEWEASEAVQELEQQIMGHASGCSMESAMEGIEV